MIFCAFLVFFEQRIEKKKPVNDIIYGLFNFGCGERDLNLEFWIE